MIPDMYIGPPLCCHRSLKRCITEIPEFSYYKTDNEIGVLLYNASRAESEIVAKNNKSVNVEISVDSRYPLSDEAVLIVNPEREAEFTVALRMPNWCGSFTATIGQETIDGVPGEFLKLNRIWKSGDKISIKMDFPLVVLYGGKSYPDHYALKYGNQVLAVDADVNDLEKMDTVIFDKNVEPEIKAYIGKLPENWVGEQAFVSNAIKTKDGNEVVLVPYADASQTGGDIRVWIKDYPPGISNK